MPSKRGEPVRMNVVVTGGGTIAPIDDVRYLANVSSGRFSAMISEACLKRGARVFHIHARSAELPIYRRARFAPAAEPEAERARLERLRAEWIELGGQLDLIPLAEGTVADYSTTLERVLRKRPVDIAFLAMAVSDFEP